MKKIAAVIAMSLLIAACGDNTSVTTQPAANTGIDGSYQMENGLAKYTFDKSGEVTYSHPNYGVKVAKYKIKDGQLEFQFEGGYLMSITIIDEQRLKSTGGDIFIKQ